MTENGLDDHDADFGNGWYNDHHFHYGYFIYAAAAVGVGNQSFVKAWDAAVRHMVRDIANPTDLDTLYPRSRYKDCLLYTSPSPRDRSLSRMPSSA